MRGSGVDRHSTARRNQHPRTQPDVARSKRTGQRRIYALRPGSLRDLAAYRDAEDADGSDLVAGHAEGVVDDVRPGERLAYRLSPLLPDGGLAFTAHVDLGLRSSDTGTDLDVHWRIADSTVDSPDFIAGIEIGFGQSLDKLAATFAADSHDTVGRTDTRSTK